MSVALVVTGGFGNGTLQGSVSDVLLRGYSVGEALASLVDFDDVIAVVSLTPGYDVASLTSSYSIE